MSRTITSSNLLGGIDKSARGLSTLLSMTGDLSNYTVLDIASFNPMSNSNHLGRYTAADIVTSFPLNSTSSLLCARWVYLVHGTRTTCEWQHK